MYFQLSMLEEGYEVWRKVPKETCSGLAHEAQGWSPELTEVVPYVLVLGHISYFSLFRRPQIPNQGILLVIPSQRIFQASAESLLGVSDPLKLLSLHAHHCHLRLC